MSGAGVTRCGGGHLGTVNPFLHVSFSNCWPSSLLRKQNCNMALPNKWTEQKRVQIIRYKNHADSIRTFEPRCNRLDASFQCTQQAILVKYILAKKKKKKKKKKTPIALSTTSPLVHVEKSIGVTHIEMKHPACCTAAQKSFLDLQDFLHLIILKERLEWTDHREINWTFRSHWWSP